MQLSDAVRGWSEPIGRPNLPRFIKSPGAPLSHRRHLGSDARSVMLPDCRRMRGSGDALWPCRGIPGARHSASFFTTINGTEAAFSLTDSGRNQPGRLTVRWSGENTKIDNGHVGSKHYGWFGKSTNRGSINVVTFPQRGAYQ
jgi:hypothetical protein